MSGWPQNLMKSFCPGESSLECLDNSLHCTVRGFWLQRKDDVMPFMGIVCSEINLPFGQRFGGYGQYRRDINQTGQELTLSVSRSCGSYSSHQLTAQLRIGSLLQPFSIYSKGSCSFATHLQLNFSFCCILTWSSLVPLICVIPYACGGSYFCSPLLLNRHKGAQTSQKEPSNINPSNSKVVMTETLDHLMHKIALRAKKV